MKKKYFACGVFSVFLLVAFLASVSARDNVPPSDGSSLNDVKSWAFWIQNIRMNNVVSSGFDMLVIDYSPDGTEERAFPPAVVERMKKKPDGSRRLILAYLSIGEAESYRYYWRDAWSTSPPAWLGEENPNWPGNYMVNFWDPKWQALIFGSPRAYLDKIIAAGFDGAYLDLVDAFEYFEDIRPAAAKDMVEFVKRISRYAKSRKKGGPFFIVPQNGEDLLRRGDYLGAIDGAAKEDLYYGYIDEDKPTPKAVTREMEETLKIARMAGKAVFTVDYVDDPRQAADVYRKSRRMGFKPYVTTRDLDLLTVNRGLDPEPFPPQPPGKER